MYMTFVCMLPNVMRICVFSLLASLIRARVAGSLLASLIRARVGVAGTTEGVYLYLVS